MFIVMIATMVVLVVLAAILWSYGPDTTRINDAHARPWRRAALAIIGLSALFLIVMGVGEMLGGDISGVSHLVPAALLVALMYFAAKRPRETGVILCAIGVTLSAYFVFATHGALPDRLISMVVGGLPWLVAGLLLLAPDLRGHGGGHDRLELGV